MAARRVADEMSEPLGGETVGYRVRFEEASGPKTKLWYLTEGVLTRRILADRYLSEARLVVLDEFHERHLETELALALLRNLQQRRKDLRLLIMSATLDADLAGARGDPPLIKAPGRLFPVAVRYSPHSASPLEEQVAAAAKAIAETKGHGLVFLPGAAEIRKAIAACEPIARQTSAKLLPPGEFEICIWRPLRVLLGRGIRAVAEYMTADLGIASLSWRSRNLSRWRRRLRCW